MELNKREPKCNTETEDANKFCSNCGYNLSETNINDEFYSGTNKESSPKRKVLIIIVLAVLCFFVIGVLTILIPKIKVGIEMENKYNDAVSYLKNSKYSEAIIEFQELDSYKDSQIKLKEAYYKLADTQYENGNLKEATENYYAAGDYNDAIEKYTSTTYEYGKQLVLEWDYINAAKQFKKIDYEDSKDLALLYAEFDTDRYHNKRFYYYAEEFEEKLNSLLQEENESFSAKIDDDNITDTPVIYVYDNEKFTGVYVSLCKYDENGTFDGIDIRWLDVSKSTDNFGTATYIYSILLADCSLSAQDANDYYMELVDKAEENSLWGNNFCNDIKNDISYNFWYSSDDDESGLLISSPSE